MATKHKHRPVRRSRGEQLGIVVRAELGAGRRHGMILVHVRTGVRDQGSGNSLSGEDEISTGLGWRHSVIFSNNIYNHAHLVKP